VHSEPERVAGALSTIQESGAQAMAELRRLLGLLRDSAAEPVASGRIAELDELVERVRATGVDVRVVRRGEVGTLEPSVDLAAYRVVQEALTNVAKHAGAGTHAVVRVDWSPRRVDIRVEDDGAGGPRPEPALSTGHGLLGLHERLGVVGGTLTAGPCRSGYRVSARLPVASTRVEVPA
jgi:signal transduction histidine kinase